MFLKNYPAVYDRYPRSLTCHLCDLLFAFPSRFGKKNKDKTKGKLTGIVIGADAIT